MPPPAGRAGARSAGPGAGARAEDDFGDSWRAYRERADHLRQPYGWTVPEPTPRAERWLPLGRNDDQERDQPRDRSRGWQGEERNDEREDR